MTSNKTYAYICVSSKDQNECRQIDALAPDLIPIRQTNIEQSVKDFQRLAYQRLMKYLKQGDLIMVKSIDWLGRNCALPPTAVSSTQNKIILTRKAL